MGVADNRLPWPAVKSLRETLSTLQHLLVCALALTLFGCASPINRSGFYGESTSGAQASISPASTQPTIHVDDPADTTVVVYNHGTTRSDRAENCNRFWNRVPGSLLSLQSDGVLIYYLCSDVAEVPNRATAGRYVYRRLAEIERTVDALLAAGVSPSRVFLAGHSAGGWASLMAAAVFPDKFNGVIAFAPAFAGKRSNATRFPHWRQVVRPRLIKHMLSAPTLPALVFAYRRDPYNRPEDLAFLAETYPDSVRFVAYGCENALSHLLHLYDCRESETSAAIADFIADRVRGGGNAE